jgi:hypothetical protein
MGVLACPELLERDKSRLGNGCPASNRADKLLRLDEPRYVKPRRWDWAGHISSVTHREMKRKVATYRACLPQRWQPYRA